MCRYPAALIALLAVAGCQTKQPLPIPPPAIVRVPVMQYVSPPEELTRPCVSAPLKDRSVESVVEAANSRKICEDRLNEQLREIRELGKPVPEAQE